MSAKVERHPCMHRCALSVFLCKTVVQLEAPGMLSLLSTRS